MQTFGSLIGLPTPKCEKLAEALVAWKKGVEQQFKHEQFKGLTTEELRKVNAQFRPKMFPIENELRQAQQILEQIKSQTHAAQRKLRPQFEEKAKELAQAQTNWRAL